MGYFNEKILEQASTSFKKDGDGEVKFACVALRCGIPLKEAKHYYAKKHNIDLKNYNLNYRFNAVYDRIGDEFGVDREYALSTLSLDKDKVLMERGCNNFNKRYSPHVDYYIDNYITEIEKEIVEEFKKSDKLYIDAETGTGKTRFFIETLKKHTNYYILIIVPHIAAVEQIKKEFDLNGISEGYYPNDDRVQVSTFDGIKKYTTKFKKDHPNKKLILVIDEEHSTVMSQNYRKKAMDDVESQRYLFNKEIRSSGSPICIPEGFKRIVIRKRIAREINIVFKYHCEKESQINFVLDNQIKDNLNIVFLNDKDGCDAMAQTVEAEDFKAGVFHSESKGMIRKQIIKDQTVSSDLDYLFMTSFGEDAINIYPKKAIGFILYPNPRDVAPASMGQLLSRFRNKPPKQIVINYVYEGIDYYSFKDNSEREKKFYNMLIDSAKHTAYTLNNFDIKQYLKDNNEFIREAEGLRYLSKCIGDARVSKLVKFDDTTEAYIIDKEYIEFLVYQQKCLDIRKNPTILLKDLRGYGFKLNIETCIVKPKDVKPAVLADIERIKESLANYTKDLKEKKEDQFQKDLANNPNIKSVPHKPTEAYRKEEVLTKRLNSREDARTVLKDIGRKESAFNEILKITDIQNNFMFKDKAYEIFDKVIEDNAEKGLQSEEIHNMFTVAYLTLPVLKELSDGVDPRVTEIGTDKNIIKKLRWFYDIERRRCRRGDDLVHRYFIRSKNPLAKWGISPKKG